MKAPLAAVIACAGLLPAHAQEQIPRISVEVAVVNVVCSVRDGRGALVTGLSREDFSIVEEGKPQQIRYFSRDTDLPLTIGLLVDVSNSQRALLAEEKRTAEQFLAKVLRPQDLAFLISFGAEAELLQDSTASVALLRRGLDQLRLSTDGGAISPTGTPLPTVYQPRGTVLYDAVYLAATEKLRHEVGRKAIVLITDGVDQGSRLKLADAIEAAHKADAVIYSVYAFDPSAYARGGLVYTPGDSDLKRMSEQTGGRLFRVSRKEPLESIFRQIQEEMRSQYSLGYVSSNPQRDNTFRRLEVRVRQKGYKVQARKGYYAVTSGQ